MKEKLLKLIGDAFSSFIFTSSKFPPMHNFAVILNSQKQFILEMSFMLGYRIIIIIIYCYITITKHKVDIACIKLCMILEILVCCDCNSLGAQVV